MKILIACECSGRVRDAFIRAGHEAISCDLKDTESPGPHYKGNVLDILGDGWDLMIAHPECTRLTNAGVRWLHERNLWDDLAKATAFYLELRNAPIKHKCIENPVFHKYAKALLGNPNRQVVQPWWFGEPYFKATGLELIGMPPLVATNKLTPPKPGTTEHKQWSAIHREPPGPNRAANRSRTFIGIAEAMAQQWGRL